MPTIPTYDQPQVQQQALPGARVSVNASPEAFGAGFGRAMQQTGKFTHDIYLEEKQKADRAATLGAANKVDEIFQSLELRGLEAKGENALGIREPVLGDYDKELSKLRNGLANEDQRTALDEHAMKRRTSLSGSLERHVGDQREKLYTAQEDIALKNSRALATQDYKSEERIGDALIEQATVLSERAKRLGWSPEMLGEALADQETKLHVDVIDRMLGDENYGMAEKYFDQHGEGITDPKVRAKTELVVREGGRLAATQGLTETIVSKHTNLTSALAEARKVKDPKVQDDVVQRVKQRFEERKAADRLAHDDALDSASRIVEQAKTTDKIPRSTWLALSVHERAALEARQKQLTTGVQPEHSDEKWVNFSQMPMEDMAKVNLMTALRPYVDDKHFDRAVEMQKAARKPGSEAFSATLSFKDQLDNTLRTSGIIQAEKTPGEFTELEATRYAKIETEVAARVDALKAAKKGNATPDEMQKIMDSVVLGKVFVDKNWARDPEKMTFELTPDERGRAYVKRESIPEAEQQAINNLMSSRGKRFTKDKLQRAYAAYLMEDRALFDSIIGE